jgi:Transposase DNA-binding/Transposase DDE domain
MSKRLDRIAASWGSEEFGGVDLGDSRRTRRLVLMAARAHASPHGRVSAVFGDEDELEGAYDFLENRKIDTAEILAGPVRATCSRIAHLPFVFVPVDGTSVTVVDRADVCDFGRIGSDANGARGLKVVDALAVEPDGTIAGWLALTFWARPDRDKSVIKARHQLRARPLEEKETRYWIQTINAACDALEEPRVRGWFQIDREGDGRDLLMALRERHGEHWWTVRGCADRSIEIEGGNKAMLRTDLSKQTVTTTYPLAVPAERKRRARTAHMVVRVGTVALRLRDKKNNRIMPVPVNVVWAREEGTTPAGEDPIDWLLYTNHPLDDIEDVLLTIDGYALRWRVEDCHRTWKRGGCNVESTQLRSFAAAQRWATILMVVAARIERLKHLSRNTPNEPATIELTTFELRALVLLRSHRVRKIPDPASPTIANAVAWIAELGGFANKYSGRHPGATVLGRGLARLEPAARVLEIQRDHER